MTTLGTLILQSHRDPLPYTWIEQCIESVRYWAKANQFDYQFLGDELFTYLPGSLVEKLIDQRVIASDLARLYLLQDKLNNGYDKVVWLDADFLIFDPQNFVLPDALYAMGREIWVQRDGNGKLKVYKNVHNAFLMFQKKNSFLPFYTETAERLLHLNRGGMPAQFIGPKLLTALHNVAQLPIMEVAGMFSPLVVKDIAQGGGEALRLFIENSPKQVAGSNLCISSREKEEISCAEAQKAIDTLLKSHYLTASQHNLPN